jgi:hypothetical protein
VRRQLRQRGVRVGRGPQRPGAAVARQVEISPVSILIVNQSPK